VTLATLLTERGQRDAARDLLAPVCGWFTEGADSPDLIEARALLAQLSPINLSKGINHYEQENRHSTNPT
jgi:hypothetical protein